MSPFEQVGGEPTVRAVIDEFVRRMRADVMIGFFFADVDPIVLAQREYELTALFLGAVGIIYSGRTLRDAHARHRIMGGQFDRRRQILKEVLVEKQISADVQVQWLSHVDGLRGAIVQPSISGQCD